MTQTGRAFVVSDGSLAALVACAAARQWADPGGAESVVWAAGGDDAHAAARRAAAARHAEAYGLICLGGDESPRVHGAAGAEAASRVLLSAAYEAARVGIGRVVWPANFGGAGMTDDIDLDAVSREVDRALLITRLAGLDAAEHGCPSVRVEAPHADFSDRQIAELALDLDAPVRTCWWWGTGTPEEARWRAALESAGMPIRSA